mmetsp:Transcript_12730/g.13865  ORF Transcript_12730/g.13865 Transcript_12730/m.13865 type:complete len:137 (+) Transcript_12730:54-464(+)
MGRGFVAMQKVEAGDAAFCAAGDFHGNANYCNKQNLGVLLKYSKELVPELCKERLCDFATTGRWKNWKWLGKSKPWNRKAKGKSMGFEDVYESCWTGPDIYKLPSLDDLDNKYQLINRPAETFNKKVCGCPTADKC